MSAQKQLVACIRCGLDARHPQAHLDGEGVCWLCRRASTSSSLDAQRSRLRERMEALFERHRGKSRYDLLLAYSGGKDSSYTLAVLRRRYRLNVLALTVDNGFLPDGALKNIHTITETLGVDSMILRPRVDLMRSLFAVASQQDLFPPAMLSRASNICNACIAVVKSICLRQALDQSLPMIAYGWSPGQAPLHSALLHPSTVMLQRMQRALREPVVSTAGIAADSWFPSSAQLDDSRRIPHLLNPLAMLEYEEETILDDLSALGWRRPPGIDLNSSNCRLNALGNQLHRQRQGYHPYTLELAGLVRSGCMSREEAIRRQCEAEDPGLLEAVRQELGLGEVEKE